MNTSSAPQSATKVDGSTHPFLTPSTRDSYRAAMEAALEAVLTNVIGQSKPFRGGTPAEVAATLTDFDLCPEEGSDLPQVIRELGDVVLGQSVISSHPRCIAHLNAPPLIPGLAAEVMLTAGNMSLDSWDGSGMATLVEQRVVQWLCQLFGYGEGADGTFTSGGTQSNLMGLLLARDWYAQKHLGWNINQQGLPPEASRFRILSSAAAHFSVKQSAALLGLGQQVVVPIEPDETYRMSPAVVEQTIVRLRSEGLIPIAIVATAGTTDFGSSDPMQELSAIARVHDVWLHVDAAYGGALILSDQHKDHLAGIEGADSITVDFHKLFWQPVSCGGFLLKDAAHFNLIRLHANYLNPESDEAMGIPNLVSKSIQTTRRFDALKLVATFRHLGRRGMGQLVDETISLARRVADVIDADPAFELRNMPAINAVVFRYQPAGLSDEEAINRINRQIRLALLESGDAIIAQTVLGGKNHLKFTLLNPTTTVEDCQAVLAQIKRVGGALAQAYAGDAVAAG